jgi:excisionase family DNA binding protein
METKDFVSKIGGHKVYNLTAAAKELGICVATLQKYLRAKKIRGRRVGKRILITHTAIKNFIEESDELI